MSDSGSGRSLVALRDQRELAIQRLSDAFVTDLLAVHDFEERLARVHRAETLAEVEAQISDLAPLPAGTGGASLVPLTVDPGLAPSATRLRAMFGNVERRGGWVVPARLEIRATFGNVELDFRDARFTSKVTELEANVLFGNLEVIVPPQLGVDCEGSSVLGNFENHGAGAVGDPERPLLRIRGRAVLGNIEVHTRLPGETAFQSAGRRRREARALRQESKKALGPLRAK